MVFHGVTKEMAKEFCRDYLGTLKAQNKRNCFNTVANIARTMGITTNKAMDFIIASKANGFMCDDNNPTDTIYRLTLYKVMESHLES